MVWAFLNGYVKGDQFKEAIVLFTPKYVENAKGNLPRLEQRGP